MPSETRVGLVGRIMEILADGPSPDGAQTATRQAAGTLQGSQRRALLALRIALLRRPAPEEPEAQSAPPEPIAPAPQPELEPEPLAPPVQKPARITMSTLRLEDAALLLSAATAPTETPAKTDDAKDMAPPPEPLRLGGRESGRNSRALSTVGDMGNAFAALAAFDALTSTEEPDAAPEEAADETKDGPQQPDSTRSGSKAKRRQGSVSASEGLAKAAYALADPGMFASDGSEATHEQGNSGLVETIRTEAPEKDR